MTRRVVCAFICVAWALVIVPALAAASISAFSSPTSVAMTVVRSTLRSLAMAAIVLPAAMSVCSCVAWAGGGGGGGGGGVRSAVPGPLLVRSSDMLGLRVVVWLVAAVEHCDRAALQLRDPGL
ncbi:MAG: hypothetical protein DLM65_07170 [Candidatus Aeolococcus gillhamiae]|uniref:Uncharacterized protein n=1 Tax=Candidatus Aeolococcus gillhamiae TaxID=3127015 RepID=A0A2W6A6H1_9BACT|nr:MAG: hypothetical protein DLM65_07170 [Candidatus Dormibacter sp. RRmetagenome_bin12]